MTGRHEGQLAPESSQRRRRQIADACLTVVTNAFVDKEQMARCAETEFDLVTRDTLDELDSETIPRDRATTDGMSRGDLDGVAICFAPVRVRQLPAAPLSL
jgi:hypothetical protein